MESLENNILSFRIVSVDHYITKPIEGLDPVYSEFRGNEITHVPIIRIFGSNSSGIKSCIHVHGVFPYLFIPFDGGEINNLNGLMHQIACSIDKAINISLNQSSSTRKHVFKIVLVKGIPFYGYHPKEHQFLKIYFYNPYFIKRASNLLQNGTILGKIFQSYDSHIPYILKFFIDFNLYGMSFLHTIADQIFIRRYDTDDSPSIKILKNDCMSVSKVEIDILAKFILNRLSYEDQQKAEHINPGISSIWNDERIRREKLNSSQVPQLAVEILPDRPNAIIADSEIFYRDGLIQKLHQKNFNQTQNSSFNSSSDISSIPNTQINTVHKKFDLKSILGDAVYPAETTKHSSKSLLDASYIDVPVMKQLNDNEFNDMKLIMDDDSMVDEEMVVNLSQRPNLDDTLSPGDLALLEVMKILEENEEVNVDNDSLLAPLTQTNKQSSQSNILSNTQTSLEKSILHNLDDKIHEKIDETTKILRSFNADDVSDSDDDILNDFSMTFDENKLEKPKSNNNSNSNNLIYDNNDDDSLWEDFRLSQFDGAEDFGTPKKQMIKTRSSGSVLSSPRGSPRRTRRKYAELNVQILKSPKKRKKSLTMQKIKSHEIRNLSQSDDKSSSTPDKSDENVEQIFQNITKSINKFRNSITKINNTDNKIKDSVEMSNIQKKIMQQKSPSVRIKKLKEAEIRKIITRSSRKDVITKSPTYKSRLYDQENNFFPQPGPSTINYYENVHIPGYCKPSKKAIASPKKVKKINESPIFFSDDEEVHSFYDKTMIDLNSEDSEIKRSLKKSIEPTKTTPLSNSAVKRLLSSIDTEPKTPNKSPKSKQIKLFNISDIEITPKNTRAKSLLKSFKTSEKNDVNLTQTSDDLIIKPLKITNTMLRNSPLGKKLGLIYNSPIRQSHKSKTSQEQIDSTSNIDETFNHNILKSVEVEVIDLSALENSNSLQIDVETCKQSVNKSIKDSHINQCSQSDTDNISEIDLTYFSDTTPTPTSSVLSIPGLSYIENTFKLTCDKLDNTDIIKITLNKSPPDPIELNNLNRSDYPPIILQQPFYSNSKDVTSGKEVGLSLLKVTDKYSIPEYKSILDDDNNERFNGITKFRKNIIENMIEKSNLSILTSTQKIKEFLANENCIKIFPLHNPPSKLNATEWYKTFKENKLMENKTPTLQSKKIPIKHRIVSCNDDNDNDDDVSDLELTLTPLTPIIENSELIPKTPSPDVTPKRTKRSFKRTKLTLNKKILSKCNNNDKENKLSQRSNTSNYSVASNASSDDFINNLFGKNEKRKIFDISGYGLLNDSSNEISCATLNNTHGFKMQLENLTNAKAEAEFNHLTTISVELFIKTRIDLRPDPNIDPIIGVFYQIYNDIPDNENNKEIKSHRGMIIWDDPSEVDRRGYSLLKNCAVRMQYNYASTEKEIFEMLVKIVHKWDPDIFVGYESEMNSWGYIIERGYVIEINIPQLLSRIPSVKVDKTDLALNPEEGDDSANYRATIKITGRIILDVWRLLRHEIALTSYTYENVMYHILHRRCPIHSFQELTRLWAHTRTRWIVIEYYMERVKGSLDLLEQLDLIGRTCELAKLFGIQFYEVLSRGSQFRVESMMMRMAKPRNFVPVSPSVQQRAHMRAPEYIPLILEPQSRMYLDPLIVLDFQSLYPSMMIGYNYCFSTCLGRVESLGNNQPFEFGASHLKVSPVLLKKLIKDNLITISPCGVVFIKSTVREGILPRMLKEILDTRLMVKQSMKLHRNNNMLQRVLHSRQLGLKLIANVTYGYTAANFSGRMPCSEVGDSVVSKGRETLENAIKMVEANKKWGAKVVYGDTDSLFVLVPGRSRQEAFQIGEEISKSVTESNPQPVKLKLEKVYQPSILQTKKRYVGYMYESPDQEEPIYEAKGIETVRRDGCPAVTKILEKMIRILFETKDVSQVKQYVCRQFSKILNEKISIQDLIFAKEFRGLNGYKAAACVPSLELTKRWMLHDKRAVPRRGERVPFVIANGPPGLPLIRLVRSPHELLNDEGLKINSMYYINKVLIPPLNRCLLLIGVDANEWMMDLPRKSQSISLLALNCISSNLSNFKKSRISQYFSTTACIVNCGNQTRTGICDDCQSKPQITAAILNEKISKIERCLTSVLHICQSCCGRLNETKCISLDCPVLYKLNKTQREFNQIHKYREILNAYFD